MGENFWESIERKNKETAKDAKDAFAAPKPASQEENQRLVAIIERLEKMQNAQLALEKEHELREKTAAEEDRAHLAQEKTALTEALEEWQKAQEEELSQQRERLETSWQKFSEFCETGSKEAQALSSHLQSALGTAFTDSREAWRKELGEYKEAFTRDIEKQTKKLEELLGQSQQRYSEVKGETANSLQAMENKLRDTAKNTESGLQALEKNLAEQTARSALEKEKLEEASQRMLTELREIKLRVSKLENRSEKNEVELQERLAWLENCYKNFYQAFGGIMEGLKSSPPQKPNPGPGDFPPWR